MAYSARHCAGSITGLDCGADDYLTKPFAVKQKLLAATTCSASPGPVCNVREIQIADLVLDTRAQRLREAGRELALTTKEYSPAEYLARSKGACGQSWGNCRARLG